VNEPELLLLDEPTTGLDPQARHLLWDKLYRLKQRGVTIVLTTHYMEEAEQLCDRLVVMDGGRFVAEGSPRSLIEQFSTTEVVELRFPPDQQESGAAPLHDLTFKTILPSTISGPTASTGATCASPPAINFTGTATRCLHP
jgi:lipooligosaccharide transport system ATP-binding protein